MQASPSLQLAVTFVYVHEPVVQVSVVHGLRSSQFASMVQPTHAPIDAEILLRHFPGLAPSLHGVVLANA